MRLRSRFGHAKQAAGQNHRLESKFWPVRVVGTLNRNAAVGFGERTRPACSRRRRAVGFVGTIWIHGRVWENGGTRFAARRRQPHARGVCSQCQLRPSRALFRLKESAAPPGL